MGRQEPAAGPQGRSSRRDSTGTAGSASRRSGRSSAAATIIRATGASGSTSAPARSATWAATFSIRCSQRSALTAPTSVRSEGDAPNDDSWGLNTLVKYAFPRNQVHDRGAVADLVQRRPAARRRRSPRRSASTSSATRGRSTSAARRVLYLPVHRRPDPAAGREVRATCKLAATRATDHYLQFVEACRGNGETSTPFSYSGPLTESVLLGCLATRFPKTTLNWDAEKLKVTNETKANEFVRRKYRKGFGADGL